MQLAILDSHIPSLWAGEKLETPGLPPEAIRHLTLLETGDKDAADLAFCEAEAARLRAD